MANEKRLIDANALMEYIHNHDYELVSRMGCVDKGMFTDGIEHGINIQPTVDAVEVVHARWENIKHFGGAGCFGFCSNCKTPQKAQNATELKWLHRYCRWCGAKMDGGNEDV